ncbi:MAG: cell division protein FtsL [Rhodospirillaceae bacterium]|nr:cell division protein FtsL [Rhodospirillaceae bacterium]|tara:strand:+ start:125 stop:409 length:285 start_codon:yes stop_codon:yes gene_type:complete
MIQRIQLFLILPIGIALVLSGVGVIKAKHEARQFFIELEALNRERDRLQVDWGRLQLEQSTWAAHPRVEKIAQERLDLNRPEANEIVVLTGVVE